MAFVVSDYLKGLARSDAARGDAQMANAIGVYALSRALTAAGITIATTASKVKTANTLTFTVNGVFYSLNASDDFWTLSGSVVAAASWQKYALLVDTAGAATIIEGNQSVVSAAAVTWTNNGIISPWYPFLNGLGSTKCCAGVLTVATDATHTFTPGSTLLSAAGVTDTYIDGLDQSLLPLLANPVGTLFGLT